MHRVERILVIDDDEAVREMIKAALSEEGYEVVEAADCRAGLKCYPDSPTELVITDLIMPEKDGIETILELRGFPAVRIIAIAGGAPTRERLQSARC